LVSIAKLDLVTVAAKFPDYVAPSVAVSMPALVTIDDLPGISISATVTRFAPTVQNADRTMQVEVDLFNGDEDDYRRISEQVKKGGPDRQTKSSHDPMPMRAFPADAPNAKRLIPGMTGTIRLTTGGFGDSYVLPSTAVYTRSGASYILIVRDGRTKQIPVRVQVTDGKTVRLAMLEKRKGVGAESREVLTELTGKEEVIIARQLEVGDGVAVKSGLGEW
jgi:multidrug efflux pump subunit AcrA (membrane-fusion protein)